MGLDLGIMWAWGGFNFGGRVVWKWMFVGIENIGNVGEVVSNALVEMENVLYWRSWRIRPGGFFLQARTC